MQLFPLQVEVVFNLFGFLSFVHRTCMHPEQELEYALYSNRNLYGLLTQLDENLKKLSYEYGIFQENC